MQLVVVRHAIAEDRDEFAATGNDDRLRPLTRPGIKKMRRAARGLRTLVPSIDLLVSSPLVRAAQTAEILRATYKLDRVETTPALEPEVPVATAAEWIATLSPNVVAIVGHEPQLGRLVGFLTGAGDRSTVELKKGAACLIALDGDVTKGQLLWAVPPRVLRGLGR